MNIEDYINDLPRMTRTINMMAKDGSLNLCYTDHGRGQMEDRNITPVDVLFVLKTGILVQYQGKGKYKGDNKIHKYKIIGVYAGDDSGRELGLVLLVEIDRFKNPAIKVKDIVTTMWED